MSASLLRDRGWARGGVGGFFSSWSQFDGPQYLQIATSGYSYQAGSRSNIVWFPGYPLTIRAVEPIFASPLVAGVIVSLVAGAVASWLLWTWLISVELDLAARRVAVGFVFVSPFAWYLYGVVYADALFLAVVLGAFVAVRAHRPGLATFLGAVATMTRPTGLAVVPALVLESLIVTGALSTDAIATGWSRRLAIPRRWNADAFRWSSLAPVLSLVGIGAWSAFLGARFGAPLAWFTNQSTYHPETYAFLKRTFFVRWRDIADDPTYTLVITLHAAVFVLCVWSIPAVCRRFGVGYGVLVAGLVAFPAWGSGDFMGAGRYLLAAFPVAAVWAERFATRPRAAIGMLAGGAALMCLGAFGFARSWYLA